MLDIISQIRDLHGDDELGCDRWVVTSCSGVVACLCFGRHRCLHLQGDGGSSKILPLHCHIANLIIFWGHLHCASFSLKGCIVQ